MEQEQSYITFEVRIEKHDDTNLQGTLILDEATISFRSDLELLMVIDQVLHNEKNIISF